MRGEVMSPVGSRLQAMQTGDVEAVLAIEQRAYEFPWSRGNFIDSLSAGYLAQVLRAADGSVLGYFLAMQGVDELHLLNITVLPECQGQGLARLMLDALQALAREHGGAQIWLEVRQGNERARRVYTRYGFAEVGLRRAYYPAAEGRREDAVLMSLRLAEGAA
ncbi:ribosomal protein S18-alanine N-acetyltransferase [Paucibacter sp. O1-1]|nr:ribosomal protein S18-alanine N-acetyltransferase [Paucibacter sp. O1-1]MDA3828846.1 ribosomal protein S18-alanine N-acetyltransferase [Paucibacter sp. O1-1]